MNTKLNMVISIKGIHLTSSYDHNMLDQWKQDISNWDNPSSRDMALDAINTLPEYTLLACIDSYGQLLGAASYLFMSRNEMDLLPDTYTESFGPQNLYYALKDNGMIHVSYIGANGRGAGSQIMGKLISMSHASKKPLMLHAVGGSNSFYASLGLDHQGDDFFYVP